jgi:hypothetical protein
VKVGNLAPQVGAAITEVRRQGVRGASRKVDVLPPAATDHKNLKSTNLLERLNEEIKRPGGHLPEHHVPAAHLGNPIFSSRARNRGEGRRPPHFGSTAR